MHGRVGTSAVPFIANDRELMHSQNLREVLLRHASTKSLVAYPASKRGGRDQELVRVSLREGFVESFGEMWEEAPKDSGLDIPRLVSLDPPDGIAGQACDLRESLQGNTETLPKEPQPGSDCCPLWKRRQGAGRGNNAFYRYFGSPICPFGDPKYREKAVPGFSPGTACLFLRESVLTSTYRYARS